MQAGERIGHYELLEELGRGGMGTVYRARDLEDGRTVALKVLPAELSLNASLVQRFRREVQTMRHLEHRHIVNICDVGEADHSYYFTMEYMAGGSLEKLLQQRGRLSVPEAIDVAIQVSEALDYSHQRNLVHRDIKPANVLLSEDGVVKLSDFGIAKVVEATRMTVTGGIVGTVDYMAPEQAEGRAITPKTDIYAMGAMLYHMLTGRVPFPGETPSQVIQQHRFSLPEPPRNLVPEMPENLSMLIEVMLQKDPAKRIPTAAALIHTLQKIKDQVATAGAPEVQETPKPAVQIEEKPVEQPPRAYPSYERRSSRWPLVVGIGILAGLVVFLVGQSRIKGIFRSKVRASELLDQARDAFYARGDLDQARELCRELIRGFPGTEEADIAQQILADVSSQKAWGLEPRFVLGHARGHLRKRVYSDRLWREYIKDRLGLILKHWPESNEAKEAQRLLDEIENWERRGSGARALEAQVQPESQD